VDWRGASAVGREELEKVVRTAPGEPYSASRVALDRQRLLELYADRGRPYTSVADSVAIDSLGARITFLVSEAPPTLVRSVVEGARETKHYVIRRELTLGRGDLLARARVLESRERLFESGFFRDVRFAPVLLDSASPPRLLDLRLQVVERKMGWMLAGVGYNSSKQVRFGRGGAPQRPRHAHRLVARSRAPSTWTLSSRRPAASRSGPSSASRALAPLHPHRHRDPSASRTASRRRLLPT
jgi:outer membrane protein assembly factor BamA